MPRRHSIRGTMGLIAAASLVLALFAAHKLDQDAVAVFLIVAAAVVVPLHLAIEANRRDQRKEPPGPA